MTKTFKILSLLLSYPEGGWLDAVPEFATVLDEEGVVSLSARNRVLALAESLAEDPLAAQEEYVRLFDQTRSLALHLFEHVHGDSRDRGQAMVDLTELYAWHGLSLDQPELPDYLPLFLEFLAVLPLQEARETLAEPLHIIVALGERLKRRGSGYAAVFEAIAEMAATPAAEQDVATLVAMPEDDPTDLEALDAIWEEEAVTFGGNQADCGPDRLQRRIRAANRDVSANPRPEGGPHHV